MDEQEYSTPQSKKKVKKKKINRFKNLKTAIKFKDAYEKHLDRSGTGSPTLSYDSGSGDEQGFVAINKMHLKCAKNA